MTPLDKYGFYIKRDACSNHSVHPSPVSAWAWGRGGEPPTKLSKRGGLTKS